MAKSIIEEIEEQEKIKRRKAIKRKKELEQLKKTAIETKEGKILTYEKDRIPDIKNPLDKIIQQTSEGGDYNSLPSSFRTARTIESQNQSQQWMGRPGSPQYPQSGQGPAPPLSEASALIEKSNKDQLNEFFSNIIRNSTICYLPGLNPGKFKFPDYGYRRLIELLMENKDFLRIFIDLEDIQGVNFVNISKYIRPQDDPKDLEDSKVLSADVTFRGIQALCDVLYNEKTELDPNENEWKHLNKILDCFAQPETDERKKTWNIKTEKVNIEITSNNTGEYIEYSISVR